MGERRSSGMPAPSWQCLGVKPSIMPSSGAQYGRAVTDLQGPWIVVAGRSGSVNAWDVEAAVGLVLPGFLAPGVHVGLVPELRHGALAVPVEDHPHLATVLVGHQVGDGLVSEGREEDPHVAGST